MSDMCDAEKNDHYDYWYDSDGVWRYENQTCTRLSPNERGVKKSSNSLYVPSYIVETVRHTKLATPDDSELSCDDTRCSALGKCPNSEEYYKGYMLNDHGQCLCQCATPRNMFVAGVHKLKVAFSHMPKLEGDFGLPQYTRPEDVNMLTVVRDAHKKEWLRFEPGEDIKVSVEDVLNIGGGYSLDHTIVETANYKKGAAFPEEYLGKLKEYPHLRVTGMDVKINVNYYNARSSEHEHREHKPRPICYVDVSIIPKWNSNPVVDYLNLNDRGEEVSRSRYNYGINFEWHISGSYRHLDIIKAIVFVGSCVIYLQIPAFIIVFLSRYCLGTLSEIYRNAQQQLLNSKQLLVGEGCRALAGMVTYKLLLNQQHQMRREAECASKSQSSGSILMNGALLSSGSAAGTTAFAHVLHSDTLQVLLRDLFAHEADLDQRNIQVLCHMLRNLLDANDDGNIPQSCFVDAFVNIDLCTLHTFSHYFAPHRRCGLLERVFDTTAGDMDELDRSLSKRTSKSLSQSLSAKSLRAPSPSKTAAIDQGTSVLPTRPEEIALEETVLCSFHGVPRKEMEQKMSSKAGESIQMQQREAFEKHPEERPLEDAPAILASTKVDEGAEENWQAIVPPVSIQMQEKEETPMEEPRLNVHDLEVGEDRPGAKPWPAADTTKHEFNSAQTVEQQAKDVKAEELPGGLWPGASAPRGNNPHERVTRQAAADPYKQILC
eukprot:gnl/TRDRNA2_/TRDRNA2_175501_c1_seq3.p1 gnl/TRDRNA2_/TRDRNA2_175501_c1~~gnl/TRDRNA2_/TRDRNA2_175501_c1_seq3.p1  ORF type:complete len:716 (+),score=101.56 gnl/TRDRNA2_/TRDRNA2_175501_c1_seq3:2-2149(+)